MSTYTKINVRSPFFLHLTEPADPLPEYDCTVAALTGFKVDNQGVITLPTPAVGAILSYTSSDGDFANNKFAVENSDTSRTISVTLSIPPNLFSNSSDATFVCTATATQAGTGAGGGTAVIAPCTGGPSTSGSIGAQTLTLGGSSVDVDLAGFFTSETTYSFSNPNPNLVDVAISGSVLTLSPTTQAGTTVVYGIGRDNSYPTTCQATQSISITVNAGVAYACTLNGVNVIQGGSITQAGVITNPTTVPVAAITAIKDSGGSVITSVSANGTGSVKDVALTFVLTAPAQFTNAGASVECDLTLKQAFSSLKPWDCDIANLTGQSIAQDGSISLGTATNGTVKSFTPPNPVFSSSVTTDTPRTVVFQVLIPSGFVGEGTTVDCTKDNLTQPAGTNVCGANTKFITKGKQNIEDTDPNQSDFCSLAFAADAIIEVTSTKSSLMDPNARICKGGTPFDGKNLYYGIANVSTDRYAGPNGGFFNWVRIDSDGIVTDAGSKSCPNDQGTGGVNVQ